ncbi:Poly(3-hydroxyalkanoate) synthetase [Olavius algarvensis associated proteobacterium Delta 3]|nr:Poly(3-hydroxyalkanoate) synthetase [Olavius algarvensis associated proteobacterium Delta 3]
MSDLGNGRFDGAHLVANFENLNPANTLWQKYYHLYANVDTEEKRFLDFEKWWGGFYFMTRKEIHTIVDGLFVGNKLERGEFVLEDGSEVDLKRNDNPVVVFASFGDNITPPQQAFNWIVKTYGTAEEIKRRGQVIVGIGHSKIGHLGIFVSAKIARKEHKEIIASFDMLNYLPPGLYEMRIKEDPEAPGEYLVSYIEKTMEDILALDDGLEDEQAFYPVMALSNANDTLYRMFVSPWIRLAANDMTAELLKQLNPLRVQRYLFSDLNPWMIPINMWASMIKKNDRRCQVRENNGFRKMEAHNAKAIFYALDAYRLIRDRVSEQWFKTIYESPWMRVFHPFVPADAEKVANAQLEALRRRDAAKWRRFMAVGSFPEAIMRIFLAVGFADQRIYRHGYKVIGRLIRGNRRLRDIGDTELQRIVRTQARILQTDTDAAIDALPVLLTSRKDRKEALSMLNQGFNMIERKLTPQERSVFDRIVAVLQARPNTPNGE